MAQSTHLALKLQHRTTFGKGYSDSLLEAYHAIMRPKLPHPPIRLLPHPPPAAISGAKGVWPGPGDLADCTNAWR